MILLVEHERHSADVTAREADADTVRRSRVVSAVIDCDNYTLTEVELVLGLVGDRDGPRLGVKQRA